MPAAAVIPALIAYIKVVAVKKLVVGSRVALAWSRGFSRHCPPALHCRGLPTGGGTAPLDQVAGAACGPAEKAVAGALSWVAGGTRLVYFEKIRVFIAG